MYVNLQQLSHKLSVHPNTIYKLIKKGLPCTRVGRDYRFNFEEVETWLKEKQQKSG